MPAEPGALIKYENTHLHLLTVWRGFPCRNKGLGFPKSKLECTSEIWPRMQRFLYNNQPLFVLIEMMSPIWSITEAEYVTSCFGKPASVDLFLCPLRHVIVFCVSAAAAAITAGASA